jgi:hypothetical protein
MGPEKAIKSGKYADLRTIKEVKKCAHISKTIDYGDNNQGKTRYLCDLWLRKDHCTNTVRISSTCLRCKKFELQEQLSSRVAAAAKIERIKSASMLLNWC